MIKHIKGCSMITITRSDVNPNVVNTTVVKTNTNLNALGKNTVNKSKPTVSDTIARDLLSKVNKNV